MKHRGGLTSVIQITTLVAIFGFASFAHAAQVAQAGDTVKIAEGQYGPEHIRVGQGQSRHGQRRV